MEEEKTEEKKPEGRRLISYITVVSVFIFFLISGVLLVTTYFITMGYLKQEIADNLKKTMDVVEHVFKDDVEEIEYVISDMLNYSIIKNAVEAKRINYLENELKKIMKSEIGGLIDFLVVTQTNFKDIAKVSRLVFSADNLKNSGVFSNRWRVVNYGTEENPEVYLIKREAVYEPFTDKILYYFWVGIDLKRNRKLIEEIINQSNVSEIAFFYGNKMLCSYKHSEAPDLITEVDDKKSGYSNPMSNLHQYSAFTDIFDSGGHLKIKFSVFSDRSENIRNTYISLGIALVAILIFTGIIVIFFIHKVISTPLNRLIRFTEIESESQIKDSGQFYGGIREFNEIAIALEKMIENINETQEAMTRAQRTAKLGSWQLEIETGAFNCSRQLHLILEKEDECAASFDQFIEIMNYDKKGSVKKAIDEALKYGIEKSFDHKIKVEGKTIWAHHIISILKDIHDKPFKIIGTVQDITERKRILDELAQYKDNLELKVSERTKELSGTNSMLKAEIKERKTIEEDLRKAKKAADEANITKSRFLANMSHEIRTPMNSIIGFLDLSIQDSRIDPEIRENLLIASNSAGSLLRILNDILDISKMEEGKLQLVNTKFSLNRMMNKILSSFKMDVMKKGLSLRLISNPVLSRCYLGDEIRITQVLINLIGNAVKFTNQGGITVRVEAVEDKRVLFEIEDTGIGISKENIEKIMEPFSQEDASSSRKFGGIGLGTSISRQLVKMMGGEFHVDSVPEKGSRFSFVIELVETEFDDKGSRTSNNNIEGKKDSKIIKNSYKILLAEDVPANAKLAELRLGQFGHNIVHVWNGEEALLRVKDEEFDIILMDVQMPVMDGLTAVREIRKFEEERMEHLGIPVIALTANVMKDDVRECMDAGMDGVVAKPVNFEFLIDEIERLITGNQGGIIEFSVKDETQPSLYEIKGVNINKGVKLWKDETLYFESLDEFFKTNVESLNELEKFILKEDFENGGMIIHRLKGLTGNLALDDIYALCIGIEEKISLKEKDSIIALIEALCVEFENVATNVSSFLEVEEEKNTGTLSKLDEKKMDSMTNLLIDAIEQNELVVAEMIIDGLSDHMDGDYFDKVRDALKNFDFVKALEEAMKVAKNLNDNKG